MQIKYFNFILVIICIATVSCKNTPEAKATTEPVETSVIEEGYELVSPQGVNDADIAIYNSSAANILKHRIENDENESWAVIEHGVWEYEFIFTAGEMSKPGEYDGHWLDFNNDHTFEYGLNGEVKGRGKYHYSPDTDLLLLVDDNKSVKPREYKVKIAGDVMIFSGSPEYKDNGMQGKLKKVMERPS